MLSDQMLREENTALSEDLTRLLATGNKLRAALEDRITKLYARNDALEALLRHNNIAVPDWNSTDTSAVPPKTS